MTQEEIIKNQLINEGYVSRNWAIREMYITRLGAIINNLKNKGWEFKTKTVNKSKDRTGDFIYELIKDPTNLPKDNLSPKMEQIRHTQELSNLQPSLSI